MTVTMALCLVGIIIVVLVAGVACAFVGMGISHCIIAFVERGEPSYHDNFQHVWPGLIAPTNATKIEGENGNTPSSGRNSGG